MSFLFTSCNIPSNPQDIYIVRLLALFQCLLSTLPTLLSPSNHIDLPFHKVSVSQNACVQKFLKALTWFM